MPLDSSVDYVDSINYTDWRNKLKELRDVAGELQSKATASRRLRYTEIDIEGERKAGRLAPDEIYTPMHLIDSNIRREQSSYIQYVTQSNRAVVLQHRTNVSITPDRLEQDVTSRLRYEGWQIPMYANIDSFQANGYSIMEVVFDQTKKGEVSHEVISMGDFGFINDTKDLQECEMLLRKYYFSKTKLLTLVDTADFSQEQVDKVIGSERTATSSSADAVMDKRDKSLYCVYKVMFRVRGVVHVAWAQDDVADDWLRVPRPLFIGRRKLTGQIDPTTKQPASEDAYETMYPYFLFPYLISENNTISQLKGRVFLDEDVQEAASSLISSFCTAHRRASGLYFSKDTDDPNDDQALQKNVFFRTGALINKKIQQFQLNAPSADMLAAIQSLVTMNMQETSQVNFAAQNRKDSRKTATEISAATQSASALTTVQVVLFSSALRSMYQCMFEIVQSRILSGLIQDVLPDIRQMYAEQWNIKPSGDTDVIERQQVVQQMMSAWPVVQNTPANISFLSDLLTKMFPEYAQKYIQIFQQSQQQQAQQAQSAQAQQQQQMMQVMQGIVQLTKHPEFFSDAGKVNALPQLQAVAQQAEQMQKQPQQQPQQPQQ